MLTLLRLTPKQFAIYYLIYVILSFILYLSISFTIAAWIICFVVFIPFYLLCMAAVIAIAMNNRRSIVRLHRPSLLLLLGVQAAMILASPASCYGWKQGQACYSLIQTLFVTLFTQQTLNTFNPGVPYWSFIDSAFIGLIGAYVLVMVLFLVKLRFER